LNPDALRQGISAALTSLSATFAAAAASATSSPNVTQTDNQIFSTTYETNTWSGNLFAQTIDPVTGAVNPSHQWDGDQKLLSRVTAASDSRNILTLDDTGVGSKVKPFAWASLTATDQAFFANANRASRVYVGANDGYLHALDGNTGNESWAYAPRFVLPAMYALADTGYPSQHRYFVDGSPDFFDVYDSAATAWKTILISGLN